LSNSLENIAEINLLGTGGGYGECIVIHLGNGDWIIVDSCINPTSNEVIPLKILADKGINPDQVKLIVCSHWHDDHIRGISEILKSCTNASFVYARANDVQKFLLFLSLDYQKIKTSGSNSSTEEFNKCLNVLSETKRVQKLATCDKLLYYGNQGEDKIEVWALSPSDKSSLLFDEEISYLITDFGPPNKKLPKVSANDRSVVILIKLFNEIVLLGADLEVNNDENLGWNDIILNSQVTKHSNKASYFKIPHHGSNNGYHEDIWSVLISNDPIGTLTPWNRKLKLPQSDMVEKYKALTKELYITSPLVVSKKPKRRDRNTEKTIRQFNSTIRELKYQLGIITSEIDLNNPTGWKTSINGTSVRLK